MATARPQQTNPTSSNTENTQKIPQKGINCRKTRHLDRLLPKDETSWQQYDPSRQILQAQILITPENTTEGDQLPKDGTSWQQYDPRRQILQAQILKTPRKYHRRGTTAERRDILTDCCRKMELLDNSMTPGDKSYKLKY